MALQGLFGSLVGLVKGVKAYAKMFAKWMEVDCVKGSEEPYAGELLFMLAL